MSSPKSTILLRNGTVLYHDPEKSDAVVPLYNTDVLIKDNFISAIGSNLTVPSDVNSHVQTIDCTSAIISPGFISTHSHLWQSQLKGRHANDNLFDYFPNGNMLSYLYSPSDTFWGQLAGSLEAVDGGMTTVLDHAHGCYTNEHIKKALQATAWSGIRGVWAWADPNRVSNWDSNECIPSDKHLGEESIKFVETAAKIFNRTKRDDKVNVVEGVDSEITSLMEASNGRLKIGFGFDSWFLPESMIKQLFNRFHTAGVTTFTSHTGRDAVQGASPVSRMESLDLLNPSMVLSHATGLPDSAISLIRSRRAPVSCTPVTEMQMGMVRSLAFDPRLPIPERQVSLGVDCHTNNTSFMPSLARTGLLAARSAYNTELATRNKFPKVLRGNNDEAFNFITLNGAKALGMDGPGGIGRIREGYLADLVIFSTNGIGLTSAAEFDPVGAVVSFSERGDVRHVIIDGVIRKKDGKLVGVQIDADETKDKMMWDEIREELLRSQRDLGKKIEGLNKEKAGELIGQMWHVDFEAFE